MAVTNLDLLTNGFNQYIVAPLNNFGLGGFVFDVEGDTTATLSSEITDHYLEDNATVQDHVAIKPKKLTLKRYVGELVYRQDEGPMTAVQDVVQKLTVLSDFLPTLSRAAQQIRNYRELSSIANVLGVGRSAISTSPIKIGQVVDYWAFAQNVIGVTSAQQRAYQYLKVLQEQRILLGVQTPFEFYTNMMIESIVAVQGENEKYVSDFTIVLKQMRFAELVSVPEATINRIVTQSNDPSLPAATIDTSAVPTEKPVLQPKADAQYKPLKNNGNVPGTRADVERAIGTLPNGVLLPPPSF